MPRRPTMRLSCRDVPELATAYTEGALRFRQRAAMRLHLALCGMCRAYMDQLEKTRRLLRGRAMPPPGGAVERSILDAAPRRD